MLFFIHNGASDGMRWKASMYVYVRERKKDQDRHTACVYVCVCTLEKDENGGNTKKEQPLRFFQFLCAILYYFVFVISVCVLCVSYVSFIFILVLAADSLFHPFCLFVWRISKVKWKRGKTNRKNSKREKARKRKRKRKRMSKKKSKGSLSRKFLK